MLIYPEAGLCNNEVPQGQASKLCRDAASHWQRFYVNNSDKFYKDRHYFDQEFPELLSGPHVLLEVGCGAGNTVFPVLDINPLLTAYACDFSSRAVELVRSHPGYSSGRVKAFVADITEAGALLANVPEGSLDFVTMVFVLSAISPAKMRGAIANVARLLRPGTGRVLFRDYARGDLAQEKHQNNGVKKLAENFYVRGDGTRCFYFEEVELADLFASLGFSCSSIKVHERDVMNHKRAITMRRRWVQAVFTFDSHGSPVHGASQTGGLQGLCQSEGAPAPLQQNAPGSLPEAMDCNEALTPVRGTWLVGAAGRLAAGIIAPGVPSGRAQLPLSLESADEMVQALSPARHRMTDTDLEEIERDFFETIARDAEEVAAEEQAAQGIAAIHLADPLAGASIQQPPSCTPAKLSSLSLSSLPSRLQLPREIKVSLGCSFLCDNMSPTVGERSMMEMALASLCAECPRLLSNRCVVEMQSGPSGIASMAAVRSARRVVATHADRLPLESLMSNLRLNSARLVVERLRVCHLAWGNRGHLTQALWQAPEPPGCFDVVISAGLLETCVGIEEDAAAGSSSSPGEGSPAAAPLSGGLWDALRTARCLVETNRNGRSLASVSVSAASTDSTAVGDDAGPCRPTPDALAVMVERRGLFEHARMFHGLDRALAGAGWLLVQDSLPEELAVWLAGPSPTEGCWQGPVAQHLDLILLRPST